MSLYPTPARLGLLAEVAGERVFRDAAGVDYISGGRKVAAQMAELAAAGWASLPAGEGLRTWRITPLGQAHRQLRIVNYGSHAVAEVGDEADFRVIGQAIRRNPSNAGTWWIQVGDGQALCKNAPDALAELRRRAAELLAEEIAEAVAPC